MSRRFRCRIASAQLRRPGRSRRPKPDAPGLVLQPLDWSQILPSEPSIQGPPTGLDLTAARAIQQRAHDLRKAASKVRQDAPVKAVHKLRVAIRSLRSHLNLFHDLLDSKVARQANKRLKKLMDVSSPVRDLDVQIKRIARVEQQITPQPADPAQASAPVDAGDHARANDPNDANPDARAPADRSRGRQAAPRAADEPAGGAAGQAAIKPDSSSDGQAVKAARVKPGLARIQLRLTQQRQALVRPLTRAVAKFQDRQGVDPLMQQVQKLLVEQDLGAIAASSASDVCDAASHLEDRDSSGGPLTITPASAMPSSSSTSTSASMSTSTSASASTPSGPASRRAAGKAKHKAKASASAHAQSRHELEQAATQALQQHLAQVLQGSYALADPHHVQALHRLRISIKKLRYTMEMLEPACPTLATWIEPAKQLQTLLGDLHDMDLCIEKLNAMKHEERLRTAEYFGHEKPMARLKPGFDCAIDVVTRDRKSTFDAVLAQWQQLCRNRTWQKLYEFIERGWLTRQLASHTRPRPDAEAAGHVPTGAKKIK